MKSYLAYHFMLSHALGGPAVADGPKNVLLLSMRDDPDAARNTLTRLIEQQGIAGPRANPDDVLRGLLAADRLEVIYNWPGCVTPNEFFHRIFVALARKRKMRPLGDVFEERSLLPGGVDPGVRSSLPKRDTAEIVVLNGLEHLDVKFPLCAGERVFVPALVSLFRCFKTCSVVVSGEDRPGSSHDIRPLADLILEFSEYAPDRRWWPGRRPARNPAVPAGVVQTSRVSAVRVPAGQLGGRWGVLGRNQAGRMNFYPGPP